MGLTITQRFEEYSINPQMQEQLLQKNIIEVILPGQKGMPMTMISSDGTSYSAFLIKKETLQYQVEDQIRWIEEHLEAIKTNKVPFFIIQDIKTIRFEKRFFLLGLIDYIISSSSKKLYKWDDLIRKLQLIVDKIPDLELPLTIEMIYVFGSILCEKKKIYDIFLPSDASAPLDILPGLI